MNLVESATSYQANTLMLLQVDRSLESRSAHEDAETDPASLSAATALQVLDPRSALTLSTQASDAILSLSHKIPHHKNNSFLIGGVDESALLTDEVFAKTQENTPARYAEAMKGFGAVRWVWRPEIHLKDIDFIRAMSTAIPRGFKDPNSMGQALFKYKSARIIDAKQVPNANIVSGYYDMYDNKNAYIGTVRRTECDPAYLDAFKAANPDLRIAPIYFGNDAVLVIWADAFTRENNPGALHRMKMPAA